MAALAGTGAEDERCLHTLYKLHEEVIAKVRLELASRKVRLSAAWNVDDLRLLKFVLSLKTVDLVVAAVEQALETERRWPEIFNLAAQDLPKCEAGSGKLCDLWKLRPGTSADMDSILPWHEVLRKLAVTYSHEKYDTDFVFITQQGCKDAAISLCEAVNTGKVTEKAFKAYVYYRVVREMCFLEKESRRCGKLSKVVAFVDCAGASLDFLWSNLAILQRIKGVAQDFELMKCQCTHSRVLCRLSWGARQLIGAAMLLMHSVAPRNVQRVVIDDDMCSKTRLCLGHEFVDKHFRAGGDIDPSPSPPPPSSEIEGRSAAGEGVAAAATISSEPLSGTGVPATLTSDIDEDIAL